MIWNKFKELIGGAPKTPRLEPSASPQAPAAPGSDTDENAPPIPVIEADRNPWNVPVLDVRPVTQTMLSTSRDPQCATNALSFSQDDGTSFLSQAPVSPRRVEMRLAFPIDRQLADGVLYLPREMEHKWAIFHHQRRILLVRSWTRRLHAVAHVELGDGLATVVALDGALMAEVESPQFSERVLDFLLRSHALGLPYPAPLPEGPELAPYQAAIWCFSGFGRHAAFATAHRFARRLPERPLRTHSLLHIAVARGDLAAVDRHLAGGMPVDLLAGDGLAPLHWALAGADMRMLSCLLDRGSPVDVRSDEGATALMSAAQGDRVDQVAWLLERGAEPDARDARGFTALHRAAEMGHTDVARVLLQRGASPDLAAGDHTPRSLARQQQRAEILALMEIR